MVKTHARKRRVIGLVLGLLLLIGAGGIYGFYYYSQKPQPPVINSAARDEVKKLNLKGDESLAAQYASALKDNDTARAQKVFDSAIANEADQQKKVALLSQNVSLALAYKQSEAALSAALSAVEKSPSFETYYDAFRVYTVLFDHAKQQEMLQKAIDSLPASDVTNKDQALAALNQQMEEVKQQISTEGSH